MIPPKTLVQNPASPLTFIMVSKLLETTPDGLFCPAGGFHIDPWRPVERAAVTHAHSDHARAGCGRYLSVTDGEGILRHRLGNDIQLRTLQYGEALEHNGVNISFHPAGHVAGSAQIRLEKDGEVLVVSGDYKVEADSTCRPFESVRCHTFVTESTFALPVYRWEPPHRVFERINAWWRANKEAGRTSMLLGYALGKAQRLIAGVDPSIGPIHLHGAVEEMTNVYRRAGISLPPTQSATITFTVYDNAGTRLGSQSITLGPLAHGASNIGPLLGLSSFTGFVKITSTIPIISLSLNYEAAPIFSSLPPGDLSSTTLLVTP